METGVSGLKKSGSPVLTGPSEGYWESYLHVLQHARDTYTAARGDGYNTQNRLLSQLQEESLPCSQFLDGLCTSMC